MVLNDASIRALALGGMIQPFEPMQTRTGKISYGLSHAGYDIRLAPELLILKPGHASHIIDPKDCDLSNFMEAPLMARGSSDVFEIPPYGFALGRSIETITMPRDVVATCLGKSTYARVALHVNVTPLEPGWSGTITLELSNMTSRTLRVYPNEGIAQLVFHQLNAPCEVSYADKRGKYQDQTGITLPRVV